LPTENIDTLKDLLERRADPQTRIVQGRAEAAGRNRPLLCECRRLGIIERMPPAEIDKLSSREQLRERSKRLFGNADRLEVAAAVAKSSGLVHAQELSESLRISPPRVRAQLLAFVEAGIMQTLPRSGLVQNYERVDDPFWHEIGTLVDAWSSEQPDA
jgi:hypothetical protein